MPLLPATARYCAGFADYQARNITKFGRSCLVERPLGGCMACSAKFGMTMARHGYGVIRRAMTVDVTDYGATMKRKRRDDVGQRYARRHDCG